MPNNYKVGRIIYIILSIIILAFAIAVAILGGKGIIDSNLAFLFFFVIVIAWILVSFKISKKQRERLEPINAEATLIEKTQNNLHSHSIYFLSFKLHDGNVKTFQVPIDTYSTFSKNDTGILSYKEISTKKTYLSNIFITFETK